MIAPPLFVGAVHETVTWPLRAIVVIPVTAFAVVNGVATIGVVGDPVPAPVIALTRNA